ncbi:2-octaprenyl-6-methoxyphenyl hydroxylase [Mergibacter septicus]|uniref:2-octaprenyl-6-methoxyphenyl hydroxylase n=1 Tax=Mergibacter septicus TaxID=221402 RepID=UPI00117955CD|nr:2-octaprenyl-6-methoxyphenyl hydroxylase [Mergibacter septicus]AWX14465.1 2-octaprenyl-6-methoxyphenyl hydroxylase [Mergibacter septicus]
MQQYDIIINGGGINGLTLALAINRFSQPRQLRIAIIERSPRQHHQGTGFDARSIALSVGTCRKLAKITLANQTNLWQQFQPYIEPIFNIHVSDQGHAGLVEFSAEELHLSQLGAVIELTAVGEVLTKALQQAPNIDFYCPEQITSAEFSPQQVKVCLSNSMELTCLLLVGADGSYSKTAKMAGIETSIVRDYQQTAVIANILSSEPHQGRAFERFTSQGPLALLPLQKNLLSLVWCLKEAEQILSLDEHTFLQHLQQQFGWRLGRFKQTGQRYAYPLRLSQAKRHTATRLALVGNAMQSLHPIAGQGFNLGIRDLFALAKAIADCQDIGSPTMLQAYTQTRLNDQRRTITLTDSLVTIFANDFLPLQIARNLGLGLLANSKYLRQQFVKPMLGWVSA